ncbi:MAG: glycosyltransferase [Nitrosomonas sp.]|nr:MAG: glycosyltransferase [Nitrosomonas sp.]
MPSLNQVTFIGEAIDSVLSQDYPNLELIVADGGSEDGTPALLAHKAAQDSRLIWSSARDSGPAHALNRALTQVHGTLIGWLNSDDVYAPEAISRAVKAFNTHPQWLMVYGYGEHIDAHGKILNRYPVQPPETPVSKFAEGCFICQPTVFFRRTLVLLLGKLDESLRTAFDFDYWLRAFLAFQARIGFIGAVQAYSRLHEDCITLRMRRTVALEGMRVLSRHLGNAPAHWAQTHVNELLDQLQGNDASPAEIRRQLADFIEEACQFLPSGEQTALRDGLSHETRLRVPD